MARYNAMTETFQEATIFGIPAMFSSVRIDRKTVPEGYHLYEIRYPNH